jgi:hypothetical protein
LISCTIGQQMLETAHAPKTFGVVSKGTSDSSQKTTFLNPLAFNRCAHIARRGTNEA